MVRNRVLSEEAKDCRKNEERYNPEFDSILK